MSYWEKAGCVALCVLPVLIFAGPISVVLHDGGTARLGRKLEKLDASEWEQAYWSCESIFSKSTQAERNENRRLEEVERPQVLKGFSFDACYLTPNGICFTRMGGGHSLNSTAVYAVFVPRSDVYYFEKRGVFFDGFKEMRWTFEVAPETRAEQAEALKP